MKSAIKPIIAIAAIALLIASCGGPQVSEDLQALEEQKAGIQDTIDLFTKKMEAIDQAIEALNPDTVEYLNVSAFTVPQKTFDHYFIVQGNVETDNSVMIHPETQGLISKIMVKEGQTVSKGQTLMTLDTSVLRKNIQEVETNYVLAKDIYERQERLWEQGIGSEVQYLEAKNRKEGLEATLSTLRTQASMGSVKSPFNGVVDEIFSRVGEMGTPAQPVVRVVSLNQMYVTSQVSENYASSVVKDMKVRVIVPGIDTLSSVIERVGQFINPENRTFEVLVNVNNQSILKPNMYAALEINDIHMDSVTVVPSSMIQQDAQNREFLYTLTKKGENMEVTKKLIQTGPSYNAETVVTSGLKEGDLIVDKGSRKVIDGQVVELESK
ncbi:MAG: efflux RND transporter periplasmic adaptor subunit [Flavobacteriales bacterium]